MLAAYVPWGVERSFEEFVRVCTEQAEDASRSTGPQNTTVDEIKEKYDSEFVRPPL